MSNSTDAYDPSARYAGTSPHEARGGMLSHQCFKFGISVSGTMRMPAASRP